MAQSAILLQFVGSLAAIAALAALAYWLKLGPAPLLKNEADAIKAADQAVSGFKPMTIALDHAGNGAIMCDADNRMLVLRPHGSRLAGRLVPPHASVTQSGDTLIINVAEKRFGITTLEVDDPKAWVQAHERLKRADHA